MAEMMMRLLDTNPGPQGQGYQFKTGTYTGDGNATQAITGVGFKPVYVIIYNRTALGAGKNYGVKSDQDGLNAGVWDGAGAGGIWSHYLPDHIISIGSDGFTVGDGTGFANVFNIAANEYRYICWGVAGSQYQATGTYVGDGAATQAITGLGFKPKYVRITGGNGGGWGAPTAWRTDLDLLVNSFLWVGALGFQYYDDNLRSLDVDGFTVGDDSTVGNNLLNILGTTYRYMAWR